MARGEAWRAVGPKGKEVKTEGAGKESAPPGPGKAAVETKKQFWTGSVELSAANSELTLQEVVAALEKAAGEGQLRMAYRSGGALAFSVRSAQAMTNLSKGGLDVGKTHLEIFEGVAGGSATRVRLFGIPLVATEIQIREGLAVLGRVERVRLECYPGSQILNGMAVAWVHLREPSAQHPATVRIGGIPTAVKVDKAPPAESAKIKVTPEQPAPRPATVPATPAPAPAEQQQQPGPTASKPAPSAGPAASKPAPAPSVPAAEGAAPHKVAPTKPEHGPPRPSAAPPAPAVTSSEASSAPAKAGQDASRPSAAASTAPATSFNPATTAYNVRTGEPVYTLDDPATKAKYDEFYAMALKERERENERMWRAPQAAPAAEQQAGPASGTRAKVAAAADSTSNSTFGSGFKLGFLSPKGGKR